MTRSLSDFLSEIKRRHLFVLVEMVDRSVEIFDGFFFSSFFFFVYDETHRRIGPRNRIDHVVYDT